MLCAGGPTARIQLEQLVSAKVADDARVVEICTPRTAHQRRRSEEKLIFAALNSRIIFLWGGPVAVCCTSSSAGRVSANAGSGR